jgi:hypothetical protein
MSNETGEPMFRTARITFAERGRDAQTDIFRVFDNPQDTDPHRLIKEVEIALMGASATSASSVGRGLTEPPPYRASQHKPLENLCSLSTLPSHSARTLPRCIARQCGRSASALCACLPRPKKGRGPRLLHRRVRVLSLAFVCGIVSLRWGSPSPSPPGGYVP